MAVLEGGGLNRTSRTTKPRRAPYNRSTNQPTTQRRQPTRRPTRPTAPAPTRKSQTYRSPSSSGARSTSRSSPGGVSTISKPPPKPPGVSSYLAGDVTYQDLVRGQQKTLADFLADINRQRGEAKTSFGDVTRSLETERGRALEAMMNEFASRGLLQSGLYGEAQSNYQQDWQNQMSSLQQGQNSLMGDFLSQETNFKREQQLSQEAARQDAIRRRAAKYGLT